MESAIINAEKPPCSYLVTLPFRIAATMMTLLKKQISIGYSNDVGIMMMLSMTSGTATRIALVRCWSIMKTGRRSSVMKRVGNAVVMKIN